jgi:hypothetical protein
VAGRVVARKESGAAWKSGKERRRSSRSSGRPWMVEAASGEGRMGRAGLVSLSYARTIAKGSGTTMPWARTVLPGLLVRMAAVLAGAAPETNVRV